MARHDRLRRSRVQQMSGTAGNPLSLEGLEARLLLTVYSVTTNLDVVDSADGVLSLREVLTAANSNEAFSGAAAGQSASDAVDIITFGPGVQGQTILLTLGELPITEAVMILAPASPDGVTIDGSGEIRIFNITGNDIRLENLTLTNGMGAGGGGAILMSGGGTLNISDCTIQNSFALTSQGRPAWGGGILNLDSTVNILRTTIGGTGAGNGAANGGAIYSQGGTVNLLGGVDITDNTATNDGAGIYMDGGALNMARNVPTIWIGTAHADPEGNTGVGGVRAVNYNITLSHASDKIVTVDYFALNLSGDTATASGIFADYQPISGTVTFLPGQTVAQATVNVIPDVRGEGPETFHIFLTNAVNGAIGNAQCEATIDDDAGPPLGRLWAGIGTTHRDVEGDSAQSTRYYNVAMSDPIPAHMTVTVHYTVSSLGGDTAAAGIDYQAVADGVLTLGPGDLSASIPVTFYGDGAVEAAKSFTITLTSIGIVSDDPGGFPAPLAILGNSVSQAWIENDDAAASTVTGNVATGSGGGLYATHATATINGVVFDSNTALDGGNLYLTSSTVVFGNDVDDMGNVTVLGEMTGGTAERDGGGLYMSGGNVTVAGGGTVLDPLGVGKVGITGNTAIDGGGIYQDGGTLSLRDTNVNDNTATSTPTLGTPVTIDGTVDATADFTTGEVTGTITGTITTGGITPPEMTLGTFTTTVDYVLAHMDGTIGVLVTVTIGGVPVGAINCLLTIVPIAGTDKADGTLTGIGMVFGSGFATFTGVIDPPPVPATDIVLTMAPTVSIEGTPAVPSTGMGGGIFATNGTLITERCQVTGNVAEAAAPAVLSVMGGGIYALYHHLRLSRTAINDNSATGNGGGLFIEHSDAILSQVTVGGNAATAVGSAPPDPDAGTISGSITGTGFGASRSTNTAFSGAGGAGQLLGVNVSGVGTGTFEGTITVDGRIVGVVTGAVSVSPLGTGNITGTTFSFGSGSGILTAVISGGGLSGTIGGIVSLGTGGTFPDAHLVGGFGGGIYVTQGSTLKLNSSTVTDNTAPIGGGVFVAYPAPIGAGIYAGEAGDVDSDSSIIASNTATAGDLGPDVYGVLVASRTLVGRGAGSKLSGSGNLIGKTTVGIDPRLAPRDADGFYDLLISSPAINTGANPTGALTDTRGWPRLFGAKYDMGAVEHQADIGPRIDVEIDGRHHVETYNFGTVALDTSKSVQFTIRNEGTTELVVSSALLTTGTVFALTPGNGADGADDWTILPGETFTFTITASPDITTPDELGIFTITSSDPTRPIHVLAVTVNQGPAVPDMIVGDVSVVEGNSGTKNAVFTVSLSSASESTVTAQYITVAGTATAGVDYLTASGLVIFAPGQTTRTIIVKILGDKADENDETFFLDLSNPMGAAVAGHVHVPGEPTIPGDPDDHAHQAAATIIDDDVAPSLRINDVRAFEGNAGVTNFIFTVSLSAPSGKIVTVHYTAADGTATAGSDYTTAIGTVTFPAGVTTQPITIAVNGDTTYEYDETFFVNLASASGATIADAQGLGTIRNDAADVAPTLNIISPAPVAEGTGGSTFINFEVTLSAASGRPVTLKYATAGGTATSGVDFAPASGTVVFAPGQTSQFIPVSIVTDALNELDETFQVKLSKVVGAQSGILAATGTITDDDVAPSLSIGDAGIFEGNSGSRKMYFTVTLSAPSGQTVLVNYATAPNTALTPADFITKTGTLTFAPGVTTQTLFVLIRGNTAPEIDKQFFVDLSVPTNATIAVPSGTGTILNDD